MLVSKTDKATQEVYYLGAGKIGEPIQQAPVSPELRNWLDSTAQKQTNVAQSGQAAK